MYRQSTAKLWTDYDLFRQKGYKAKLGGAKDDISILMTYVCHDAYLKPSGKLGFVITQSVFKTKGGCMSSELSGQVGNRFKRGSGPSELKLRPRMHDAAGDAARWFCV
jgi:hypothetical protein